MSMKSKDSLGDRMKGYEFSSTHYLTKRVPVIIRVDGKAFHTFCRRFERPYDKVLNAALNGVMAKLCLQIQGVKIAQRHSDEISFVVTDYDKITTSSFFEYGISKICSVVSGLATAEFCRQLVIEENKRSERFSRPTNTSEDLKERTEFQQRFDKIYLDSDEDWPSFDCRCFNIPESDIANYIWWRLLDCKRNSISMLAQSKFTQKELQGKNCDQMQEMLFAKHGINWAKIPQEQKSGYLCVRKKIKKPIEEGPNKGKEFERDIWEVQPSPSTKSELDQIIANISFRDEARK